MRSALACLFFVLLPASACTAGSGSILEAGPRFPDHEGVVTEISFEQLVLDGDTTLKIREDVESFTSAGHRVTALLTWQNRYVHLGMADGEVKWIAGIGIVRKSDSIVTYSGEFVSMERGRAVFEDGTALRLEDGLRSPKRGDTVVAFLDARSHRVTDLRVQENGQSN